MTKLMVRIFATFSVTAFLAGALFVALPVRAADELDLDRNDDQWFDVKNMAPGESKTEEFCAQNDHASEAGDYYLNVEDVTDSDLADELKFYLIDRSSGKYLIGGSGDRFTVDEMNEKGNVFIERLEPSEENCYKMRITFDEDAGNQFQNRKTVFDLDFTLVSEVAEGETPPFRPGAPEGGVAPTPEEAAAEVQGAETGTEETVAGAAAETCSSWPLWAWILLLAVHTGLFNVKRIVRKPLVQRWGLAIQIGSTAAALVFWYLFDVCREYWPAIPILIVGISVISPFLLRVRKNAGV